MTFFEVSSENAEMIKAAKANPPKYKAETIVRPVNKNKDKKEL